VGELAQMAGVAGRRRGVNLVRQPDDQRLLSGIASKTIGQRASGDPEEPRSGFPRIVGHVVQSPPGDEKDVGDDVLGVRRVRAPLDEPNELLVGRGKQLTKTRFIGSRRGTRVRPSRQSGTHTSTCPAQPESLHTAVAVSRRVRGRPKTGCGIWLETEGEGFEPSMDEKTPITVFETAAFNRSATPPGDERRGYRRA
jgi:hypothetical protein